MMRERLEDDSLAPRRVLGDPRIAEAHDGESERREFCIPAAVVLYGDRIGMECGAVNLDNKTAVDHHVDSAHSGDDNLLLNDQPKLLEALPHDRLQTGLAARAHRREQRSYAKRLAPERAPHEAYRSAGCRYIQARNRSLSIAPECDLA
jgi:hypothetical protein